MKLITEYLLIKSMLKVRFYFMLTLSLFETDLPPSYLDQLDKKKNQSLKLKSAKSKHWFIYACARQEIKSEKT